MGSAVLCANSTNCCIPFDEFIFSKKVAIQIPQDLLPKSKKIRVDFCTIILQKQDEDDNFIISISVSLDEAEFFHLYTAI